MKNKLSGKKAVLIIAAVVLLIAVAAGGTFALLFGETSPVTNVFVPGDVKCAVDRTDTAEAIQSARVQNTGNVRAYIRVSVTGNTVDGNGYLTGNSDLSEYLVAAGWTQGSDDGFYYYGQIVEPNAFTGVIFTKEVPLANRLVTVLAEAIQADGMPGVTNAQQAFEYARTHGGGD